MLRLAAAVLLLLAAMPAASAALFDVRDHGATPDDATDDTRAIAAALAACRDAGGGTVRVPAGVYVVSRQGSESPILSLPSDTILEGDGAASVLKFDPKVNGSNFWRMLGSTTGCSNVVVRDLRLDGSNTHPRYERGVPEQSHGLFFSSGDAPIENVLIRDLLVENFAGDCVAIGRGCRGVTIRDVTLRNFLRQGVQLAGGDGAGDYLITGCRDLEHSIETGGSTIHVEHARGLTGVVIAQNHCRRSILAGGVDGLILRDNVVTGRIVGNGNRRAIVQGNVVRGGTAKGYLIQLGYAEDLIVRDNVVTAEAPGQGGIYVWGASKYNPEPSREASITGNVIRSNMEGVLLSGVEGATVSDNRILVSQNGLRVVAKRAENVITDGRPAAPGPSTSEN